VATSRDNNRADDPSLDPQPPRHADFKRSRLEIQNDLLQNIIDIHAHASRIWSSNTPFDNQSGHILYQFKASVKTKETVLVRADSRNRSRRRQSALTLR